MGGTIPSGADPQSPLVVPKRWVLALLAIFAILAVLPIVLAHHLPLLDAPAHDSRLAILRNLLTAGQPTPFYSFDSFFIPNIAFDLIGLGLLHFVSPEIAGRIFFALTLLLTLSGVTVLNRVAVGRWGLAPLASALLLYNLFTILGFFSYAFGLALVPWLLAGRLRLNTAPNIARFLVGAGFGILLLFCHVFDFAIYAVMLSGFALAGWIRRRGGFVEALVQVLEMMPAGLLFLAMSTGDGSKPRYAADILATKAFEIFKSLTSASMIGDVATVAGILILILLLAWRSRTRLVAAFVPGLVILTLLYFVMPSKLASGSYVDSRLPVAIALLLLGGLDVRFSRKAGTVLLLLLIGVTITVKQVALAALWRSYDEPIDAFAASLDAIPAGGIVLQSLCSPPASDVAAVYRTRQPSLEHMTSLGDTDNRYFVAENFAIAGQQPIIVTPRYQPYADLQGKLDFACSTGEYRSQLARIRKMAIDEAAGGHDVPPLYFVLIRPQTPLALAKDAKLIASGTYFELYAVET